jgi:hypothetical protein
VRVDFGQDDTRCHQLPCRQAVTNWVHTISDDVGRDVPIGPSQPFLVLHASLSLEDVIDDVDAAGRVAEREAANLSGLPAILVNMPETMKPKGNPMK